MVMKFVLFLREEQKLKAFANKALIRKGLDVTSVTRGGRTLRKEKVNNLWACPSNIRWLGMWYTLAGVHKCYKKLRATSGF
jgi:hypothetical protein